MGTENEKSQYSEPSKEEWTDRNKSRRKNKSVYLNEMTDPIVLEPELKQSKNFKSNKIFKNIEKNTGKTRQNLVKVTLTGKRLHLEKRKNIFSRKKLIRINTKKMTPRMVLTYVKNVNHLRKGRGWSIAQTVSFGTMTMFSTIF